MGTKTSKNNTASINPGYPYPIWVTKEFESQYIAPYDVDEDIKEMTNQQLQSSLRFKLLVNGYIRHIQNLLTNNTIPDSIYCLCLTFYHPKSISILWQLTNQYQHYQQFGILDIDTNKSSFINLETLHPYDESECLYIPNISTILPVTMTNNHNKLDGIFSGEKKQHFLQKTSQNPVVYESYPCLILYKQSTHDVTATYEYQSDILIKHEPHQFLYCSSKNVIIYEWNGLFYQLNLRDIQSKNDLSKFVALHQNEQRFKLNQRCRSRSSYEYLNMLYLENKALMFSIRCKTASCFNSTFYSCGNPKETKCGIFNMDNNNWIDIKPYKYVKKPNDDGFMCLICCDENYDNVYLYDYEMRYTSRYDLNKNVWKMVSKDFKERYYSAYYALWMDDNILYGLSNSMHMCTSVKFQLNSLDLRDNKRKWMANSINLEGIALENNKTAYFSIFT